MNITPVFNQVLAGHDAQPVEPYVFRVENLDEFLKEAYRIVGHVTRLELEGSDANKYNSVHTSQSSTQTSSRYGKVIFPPRHHHDESSLRAPTIPLRLPTKTRSTSPMRNVTRSMPKRSNHCES